MSLNGQVITIQGERYALVLLSQIKRSTLNDSAAATLCVSIVAKHFGLRYNEIMRPNKAHRVVEARHMVWYIMHVDKCYTCSSVAKRFKVDHTTILYACDRMNTYIKLYEKDAENHSICLDTFDREIFLLTQIKDKNNGQ